MPRNYEVRCRPIPAADVGGFQFYRDQYGPSSHAATIVGSALPSGKTMPGLRSGR